MKNVSKCMTMFYFHTFWTIRAFHSIPIFQFRSNRIDYLFWHLFGRSLARNYLIRLDLTLDALLAALGWPWHFRRDQPFYCN